MADLQKLGSLMLGVAQDIAPLIVPGAPAAIRAGEGILKVIKELSDNAEPATKADLEGARAVLEARVNAHADETIGRLRGG